MCQNLVDKPTLLIYLCLGLWTFWGFTGLLIFRMDFTTGNENSLFPIQKVNYNKMASKEIFSKWKIRTNLKDFSILHFTRLFSYRGSKCILLFLILLPNKLYGMFDFIITNFGSQIFLNNLQMMTSVQPGLVPLHPWQHNQRTRFTTTYLLGMISPLSTLGL